jgi:DNA adenine methylase
MFSYIGGKSRISKWIKEYIPNDMDTYVEPFGGAFWVYIKSDIYKNFKKVIYNDINPLNANLFLCIKDYKKFYEFIKDEPTRDGERFKKYQNSCFKENFIFDPEKADFQKGLEYLYIITHVFSGAEPHRASMIKKDKSSKLDAFKKRLNNPKLFPVFDKIYKVECKGYEDLIKIYDSELTYFYCDPPYYEKEHYYSNHPFNKEEHVKLSNILKSTKGKFSLSYYEFEDLDKWFPKTDYNWEYKDFSKQSAAKKGEKQQKTTELLIMNYDK